MSEYTHLKLHEDVHAISGYYTPAKEERLKYKGREVLYILGQATLDSSCCGYGCWCYTNVPGYVMKWKNKTNENGLPVSEIEPVTDKKEKEEIKKLIRAADPQAESVCEIYFW